MTKQPLKDILNGVLLGGMMFWVMYLTLSSAPGILKDLIAGCVAGWVARRYGWISGLIIATFNFIALLCIFLKWKQEYGTHPGYPLITTLGDVLPQLLSGFPLIVCGAFIGSYIHTMYEQSRERVEDDEPEPDPTGPRLITSVVSSDWSILNGIIIGLIVECLVFFLAGYSMFLMPLAGGIVSGCIARRNSWIAGTVLGLISFGIGIYLVLLVEQKYGAQLKSLPNVPYYPVSYHVGQMMSFVPLSAVGGFIGGRIRFMVQRYAGG